MEAADKLLARRLADRPTDFLIGLLARREDGHVQVPSPSLVDEHLPHTVADEAPAIYVTLELNKCVQSRVVSQFEFGETAGPL